MLDSFKASEYGTLIKFAKTLYLLEASFQERAVFGSKVDFTQKTNGQSLSIFEGFMAWFWKSTVVDLKGALYTSPYSILRLT